MPSVDVVRNLALQTSSRIVMIVVDGLGGLPDPETGLTELETANTPNLDKLSRESACGLVEPVGPGITPGSGPSHLALFGYDPLRYEIGRGVLEALGLGIDLEGTDVAARANFATVDADGIIIDRRAGRLPSEKTAELCGLLSGIRVEGAQLIIKPGKAHRFAVVFRGEALSGELSDSDPHREGVRQEPVKPLKPEAERTAAIINDFIRQAHGVLAGHAPANSLLMRGFAKHPDIPTMSCAFRLRPAAIATYPMYRGLAKLVGMEILPTGQTIGDEIKTLGENLGKYDFFYIHIKETDSSGEDGNFRRKVEILEEVDRWIPAVLEFGPEVVIVTGDHSTPARSKGHSWHPVPVLLYSKWSRRGKNQGFNETECLIGSLGRFPSLDVMPLAMACALKLDKYGA